MTLRLEVNDRATADLEAISDYLESRAGSAIAHRFLSEAFDCMTFLCERPGFGTLCEEHQRQFPGLRRYFLRTFKKYVVYYYSEADVLHVMRVLHGARNRDAILNG